MKKYLLMLIFIFIAFLSFGQKNDSLSVIHIKIDEFKYVMIVKIDETIIYSGNFSILHNLPIGTHFQYTKNGEIDKMIAYEFSEVYFEGVPEIIQTTHIFKNNQIQFIKSATRCTECEFSPIGIWKYFDENGKLIKQIDTSKESNTTILEHPLYEYYWQYLEK